MFHKFRKLFGILKLRNLQRKYNYAFLYFRPFLKYFLKYYSLNDVNMISYLRVELTIRGVLKRLDPDKHVIFTRVEFEILKKSACIHLSKFTYKTAPDCKLFLIQFSFSLLRHL
jgi:hypothetical protein